MDNLRITPLDKKNLDEVAVIDPLMGAFRRAMRVGNTTVIVMIRREPYIFFVQKSTLGIDKWYARLLNEDGEIVAICDFDKFDL
jgi:hypothetical protein